jgi:hypothetical protein
MKKFIVSGIQSDSAEIYILNTSPVIWTINKEESKPFMSYNSAKFELEDNFLSLSAAIMYTNLCSIWIIEVIDDIEVRRERFI